MIESNNDLAREWYRFAMMDLISAKHLCSLNPKPLEIICYHCQQSAEKLLKGFLVSNNIETPKTHDLVQLRDMCAEVNGNFEELYDVCAFLTRYGVQPRYPNEIEVLEEDAERALQSTHIMAAFFESRGYYSCEE